MTGAIEVRETLTRTVCELVDIPSVSRDETAITDFIRGSLPDHLELVHDDDTVLVAVPRRRSKPLVMLTGHTDTVPISDNVPSECEDTRITGRGATDMKSGLAVMLQVASHAPRPEWNVDVGLCFFGREEVRQSENPLPAAITRCKALRDTDLAILMEPTSNAIEVGCLGYLTLGVTFSGTAAHTARPWLGDNAAHKAVLAMTEIALDQPRDVFIDDLVFQEVVSITAMESGVAPNVVPATASVELNVRYAPNRVAAEVEDEWKSRFATADSVEVISHAPAGAVVAGNALVEQLLSAGADSIAPKQAWTNVADFSLENIAAVNFGPGNPALAHRDDEYVEIDDIIACYETLARFISGPHPLGGAK